MKWNKKPQLVVGIGEIGYAVYKVLSKKWEVYGMDVRELPPDVLSYRSMGYSVIHICIPHSDEFVKQVQEYKESYPESLIIVHSTVPLGTCSLIGRDVVHSPVRGLHPCLEEGIATFMKYFGGTRAYEASKIFDAVGVKTSTTPCPEDTEAAKLWDTTQFGVEIMINKVIYQWCKENGVSFDFVYKEWNKSYDEGYRELNKGRFSRPFMDYVPGKISGHCVMPNCGILKDSISSMIQVFNDKL